MSDPLPSFFHVKTPDQWADCYDELITVPQFAIDLESNGLYAYSEQICLIQISTRENDYIIDPLADIDLEPLGDLIGDPAIEKVLHASEYDLILMKRERDWDMVNLWDTMWGARVIGHEKIGLASVLGALYGMEIDKKYQRANWCQRPLNEDQLAYAQTDTHFLLQLRDDLESKLAEMKRLEEAQEIFVEQSAVRLPDVTFSADSFWSIQGAKDLDKKQLAVLRELNIFRNEVARERNRPAFKVFGNRTLIELAERMPRRQNQLFGINGLRGRNINRYSKDILQAVERGLIAKAPQRPERGERPPDDVANRYEKLHNWRKATARKREIASDVVMTRETMWDIARAAPNSAESLAQVASFGAIRRNLYGARILSILND